MSTPSGSGNRPLVGEAANDRRPRRAGRDELAHDRRRPRRPRPENRARPTAGSACSRRRAAARARPRSRAARSSGSPPNSASVLRLNARNAVATSRQPRQLVERASGWSSTRRSTSIVARRRACAADMRPRASPPAFSPANERREQPVGEIARARARTPRPSRATRVARHHVRLHRVAVADVVAGEVDAELAGERRGVAVASTTPTCRSASPGSARTRAARARPPRSRRSPSRRDTRPVRGLGASPASRPRRPPLAPTARSRRPRTCTSAPRRRDRRCRITGNNRIRHDASLHRAPGVCQDRIADLTDARALPADRLKRETFVDGRAARRPKGVAGICELTRRVKKINRAMTTCRLGLVTGTET